MSGRWEVDNDDGVLRWNDKVAAQVTGDDRTECWEAYSELIACVHDAARWREHQTQLAAAEARAAERRAWRRRRGYPNAGASS